MFLREVICDTKQCPLVINLLKEAGTLTVNSPTFQKELQKLIASIALEDDAQLEEINGEIDGKK
ncbi:MAG: hypothetical protein RI826_04735 [Chlorobium phaeovibrioides]|nr:hypothetical protein [Chlorobium phaeovibrioides]